MRLGNPKRSKVTPTAYPWTAYTVNLWPVEEFLTNLWRRGRDWGRTFTIFPTAATKSDFKLRIASCDHIAYRRWTKFWCVVMNEIEIATLAKALAHPARIRILRLLAASPGCIGGDIVQAVNLAQSTVSEHLRILKSAGLISGEIDGPRICYALNPAALTPLAAFLASLDRAPVGECCVPTSKVTP